VVGRVDFGTFGLYSRVLSVVLYTRYVEVHLMLLLLLRTTVSFLTSTQLSNRQQRSRVTCVVAVCPRDQRAMCNECGRERQRARQLDHDRHDGNCLILLRTSQSPLGGTTRQQPSRAQHSLPSRATARDQSRQGTITSRFRQNSVLLT
jgi:hypothetical protein